MYIYLHTHTHTRTHTPTRPPRAHPHTAKTTRRDQQKLRLYPASTDCFHAATTSSFGIGFELSEFSILKK